MLQADAREGRVSVRYGLLALLDEAPSHGYNLKTAFERRTGGSWALNIGQVYTTIQRLERDGLVEALDSTGADDDRREYRITPPGRAQLAAWFENPVVAEAPARDELTIKVLLAVAAGDVDVTALLQRQRRASIEQLQAYTRRKAQADPTRDVAFLILLDALIFRTEAEIRWLDACDARIRSLAITTAAPPTTSREETDR
jgi:DNA-binding PadR family transcriptional regulator